ncbi:hypothetical protein I204_02780 [Kwoniella mangroviensis CBS 8886]|nr:hypothetical protein I204_02780 [Kwoniella mangroviensis CBS 8886]
MSRNLLIYLFALSSLSSSSLAFRHGQNQLRDLYAYPKYEIQFLNDLPLSKSDAERCQSLGLDGEGDWLEAKAGDGRRRLGDGNEVGKDHLELIPMNFAHPSEPSGTPYPYLCLMPSTNTTTSQTDLIDKLDQVEEVEDELDPVQGWQALSHLDGKCLFTKQGWFTYSYCHNSHIRQFHSAPHPHPHPPGGLVPTEDTHFDAYTLGQVSPGARQRFAAGQHQPQPVSNAGGEAKQKDLQIPNSSAQKSNTLPSISIGSSSSSRSRYLLQKWSYGTRCDKTGKPREVEVQIHCSMTTSDMIYMIKEMSICQYVLIIHSPYLCGLPGFKNHNDHLDEIRPAPIRCRQVVDDQDWLEWEKENQQGQKQKQEQQGVLGLDDIEEKRQSQGQQLQLPYGKRPTGADTPPSEKDSRGQEIKHHFGLQEPNEKFPHGRLNENGDGDEEIEIVFEGSDVEDESLRNMLKQALDLLGKKTLLGKSNTADTNKQEEEEEEEEEIKGEQVIFYSWEEGDEDDEQGPILLNADLVVLDDNLEAEEEGEGEGEGVKEKARVQLGNNEKDVLEKVVRDFLSQKKDKDTKREKKDRNKDEL